MKSVMHGLASIKGTVLELMAKNLPASDVQFLASKWGLSKTIPPPIASSNTSPAPATEKKEEQKAVTATPPVHTATTAIVQGEVYLLHPLLGELVSDLKYKKLYVTSVRALAEAPVWQKQRTLRLQRAAMIVKNKKKNQTTSLLPGVISMYHDISTNEVGIFDGQHRAAALVLLAKEGLWNEFDRNVTVDVFETRSDAEIKTLFTEINAAEPVKLIDMPDIEEESIATETARAAPEKPIVDTRAIINEAVEELSKKYSKMFKESQNCRPPHVNMDVLRDEIFQSDFISRRNVTTAGELVRAIEEVNASLAKVFRKNNKNKKDNDKREKARENNFYLGLNKTWMHEQDE